MKTWRRKTIFLSAVLLLAGTAIFMMSTNSRAQESADAAIAPIPILPTPYDLVSNLDLACHNVRGGQTPARSVTINHLNPVLRAVGMKKELAQLGRLEQLCVPVAKNNVTPPRPALDYIRWIDLACYKAESDYIPPEELNPLKLSHLNPVLREMGLPPEKVIVGPLEQVCVPVEKKKPNASDDEQIEPPDYVKRLIEHVDVACYAIKPHNETDDFHLHLTHLNPVLKDKEDDITAKMPEQLCVPVAKNGWIPPRNIRSIVQWIDLKKYEAVSPEVAPRPIPLTLSHLNPLYAESESFDIHMYGIDQIAVPVAKNGKTPPDNGIIPIE